MTACFASTDFIGAAAAARASYYYREEAGTS